MSACWLPIGIRGSQKLGAGLKKAEMIAQVESEERVLELLEGKEE